MSARRRPSAAVEVKSDLEAGTVMLELEGELLAGEARRLLDAIMEERSDEEKED